MSKKKYELVIFDWDGTLYDSFHSCLNYLKKAVIDVKLPVFDEAEYTALSGLSMTHIIDALYIDHSEESRNLLKIRYRFHALLHQNTILLYPDAKEVLMTLKQQEYLLGIATGKSAKGLARDLEMLRIASWFDATRTADQTFSKPNPLILEQIMTVLNVTPDKALFVGDGILDIQTAVNAHVDAVGVHPNPGQQEAFKENGAKAVINTLTELLRYLA